MVSSLIRYRLPDPQIWFVSQLLQMRKVVTIFYLTNIFTPPVEKIKSDTLETNTNKESVDLCFDHHCIDLRVALTFQSVGLTVVIVPKRERLAHPLKKKQICVD